MTRVRELEVEVGEGLERKEGRRGTFAERGGKKKKEEFTGFMENMLPGNSFPQICVVSVNQSVGNLDLNVVNTDRF
jgi:hypothetical protein